MLLDCDRFGIRRNECQNNMFEVATKRLVLPSMHKKILIMGLPGAGKTTLARQLAPRLNAVHYNADDVRANINRDLGFSEPDRVEHARRMGWLCDQVVKAGCFAVADFICPTSQHARRSSAAAAGS